MPQRSIFGTKLRCWVFAMALEKSISRPGIRVKTESMLNRMALMRIMPMSKPIRNCMNIIAARPEMVVRLLAEIEGMAALTAAMQASRSSAYSRSSRKRWSMMMA